MDIRLTWKTLVIATSLIFLPQFSEARTKDKSSLLQTVENYLSGQPTPTAVLKVKVYDEDNQPITGAMVKLKRKETGDEKVLRITDIHGNTENSSAKTDYELEVTKPGYAASTKFIYLDKGLTEIIVMKKLEPADLSEIGSRMPASEPTVVAAEELELD